VKETSVHARSIFVDVLFAFAMTVGAVLPYGLSARLAAEESRPSLAPESTSVTRQEVWQAIVNDFGKRGLAEPEWPRAEDLDMPAALPALGERKLRVLSACWDEGPRRTQFRLDCGAPGGCLPFLVYLHQVYLAGGGADGNGNGPAAHAESCRLTPRPLAAPLAAVKPMVRPGDRARAVFLASGLRMTASVTCLERGREGEVIRVRAVDGHIFRARISGPDLLEALPQ
jgi:hypothetical protein